MAQAEHIFDTVGDKDNYTVTEIARGLQAVQPGASIAAKRQQIWRAITKGNIAAQRILPQCNGACSVYLIPRSQLPIIFEGWVLNHELVE